MKIFALYLCLIATALSLCLAGCSGPDQLLLHNDYGFAVLVYSSSFTNDACSDKKMRLEGTVPAHTTSTLMAGPYGNGHNACVSFETEQGKKLGWLNIKSPLVKTSERFNGSVIFETTIGQTPLTELPPGDGPPSPRP